MLLSGGISCLISSIFSALQGAIASLIALAASTWSELVGVRRSEAA